MPKKKSGMMSGRVQPGFEAVPEAFVENFSRRHELGAACCVYYQGEKVVDLWGGVRDKATGEPWQEDTMVCVFSTAKSMVGLAIALAHSRGLLDYEERVCAYWPEFAQQGKEMCFSLGFLKPNRTYPFGSSGASGEPGAGGSFAFADPEAGVGYAFVMNRMGAKQGGDPRDLSLRDAFYRAIS
jgi:CubicO group peptidase (beta-lactamase class C family)